MEDPHILEPFIPATTTAAATATPTTAIDTSSSSPIISRLLLLFFIGLLSIWANYEASKGFEVNVINEADDTPAGRRFALFFVSNDKITRIVLNTSQFAEKILYPDDSFPKKPVNRVVIRFSSRKMSHPVVVESKEKDEFVLHISPSVMEDEKVEKAMVSAVQRGMARLWIWGGEKGAPTSLLDGMVEYISISAGFPHLPDSGNGLRLPESNSTCWDDKDSTAVANFLNYCEGIRNGFIGRLNQAMQDPWHNRTMDDALGLPAQTLCSSYYSSSTVKISKTVGPMSLPPLRQVS
ncbi:PREDICTED: uncharacterized protein LOC104587674 [Nelumbo nucifera]|uniref:Uncharacterized protein LOC104587674 n=2 Tax=Nelumbo nucifera TaxID=4432 RepID=A0A1U7YW99_NELNU|nr:PREDICTED: uncharacterized protein LOC104587674 [Nelumbo nucifera]DAD37611.1 TPA_asm: hypothetical protein HUJ06_008252 [Nelumbo nucifera]